MQYNLSQQHQNATFDILIFQEMYMHKWSIMSSLCSQVNINTDLFVNDGGIAQWLEGGSNLPS